MTLTEILAEARNRLGDKTAPYLWADTEIVNYLNGALNEVAKKKRLFRDSKTAAICQITVLAADLAGDYLLDARVTEILSAKMRSQTRFLVRTSKAQIEAWNPDWRNMTAGTPQNMLTDYSEGYLTISPKSSVNDYIDLTVYRLPAQSDVFGVHERLSEIALDEHERLFNGIMCRAYLKDDSETLDPQKAATHRMLWAKDMDEIAKAKLRFHDSGQFLGPHPGAI